MRKLLAFLILLPIGTGAVAFCLIFPKILLVVLLAVGVCAAIGWAISELFYD